MTKQSGKSGLTLQEQVFYKFLKQKYGTVSALENLKGNTDNSSTSRETQVQEKYPSNVSKPIKSAPSKSWRADQPWSPSNGHHNRRKSRKLFSNDRSFYGDGSILFPEKSKRAIDGDINKLQSNKGKAAFNDKKCASLKPTSSSLSNQTPAKVGQSLAQGLKPNVSEHVTSVQHGGNVNYHPNRDKHSLSLHRKHTGEQFTSGSSRNITTSGRQSLKNENAKLKGKGCMKHIHLSPRTEARVKNKIRPDSSSKDWNKAQVRDLPEKKQKQRKVVISEATEEEIMYHRNDVYYPHKEHQEAYVDGSGTFQTLHLHSTKKKKRKRNELSSQEQHQDVRVKKIKKHVGCQENLNNLCESGSSSSKQQGLTSSHVAQEEGNLSELILHREKKKNRKKRKNLCKEHTCSVNELGLNPSESERQSKKLKKGAKVLEGANTANDKIGINNKVQKKTKSKKCSKSRKIEKNCSESKKSKEIKKKGVETDNICSREDVAEGSIVDIDISDAEGMMPASVGTLSSHAGTDKEPSYSLFIDATERSQREDVVRVLPAEDSSSEVDVTGLDESESGGSKDVEDRLTCNPSRVQNTCNEGSLPRQGSGDSVVCLSVKPNASNEKKLKKMSGKSELKQRSQSLEEKLLKKNRDISTTEVSQLSMGNTPESIVDIDITEAADMVKKTKARAPQVDAGRRRHAAPSDRTRSSSASKFSESSFELRVSSFESQSSVSDTTKGPIQAGAVTRMTEDASGKEKSLKNFCSPDMFSQTPSSQNMTHDSNGAFSASSVARNSQSVNYQESDETQYEVLPSVNRSSQNQSHPARQSQRSQPQECASKANPTNDLPSSDSFSDASEALLSGRGNLKGLTQKPRLPSKNVPSRPPNDNQNLSPQSQSAVSSSVESRNAQLNLERRLQTLLAKYDSDEETDSRETELCEKRESNGSIGIRMGTIAAGVHKCTRCCTVFNTATELMRHDCIQHHNVRNPRPTLRKATHECEICGAMFVQKCHLNLHRKTIHEGVRAYKCSICDMTFHVMETLKAHLRFHNNERLFECRLCDYAEVTRSKLNYHYTSKHGLLHRKYSCHLCISRYFFEKDLTKHLKDRHKAKVMQLISDLTGTV